MLDKFGVLSYFATAMSNTTSDGEKPTGSERESLIPNGRHGNETLIGQPVNSGMAGSEREAEMVQTAIGLPTIQSADQPISVAGWSLAVAIGLMLWAMLFAWVL